MATYPTFDDRFDALAAISYRVAYRLVGDRHEAENLAQEALARAFARWTQVREYDEAWVTRVTTNLAIGYWRQGRRALRPVVEETITVDHMAQRMDLAEALRRLPRRQREVLSLRYLADLTEVATAQRLGCSLGTVKQHASRGLRTMRSLLDSSFEEPGGGNEAVGFHFEGTTGAESC
jgi:RNA polymerase sigma factor (sigma-70 family)